VDEKNKHRERNNTGRGKVTRRTNTDGEKELGGKGRRYRGKKTEQENKEKTSRKEPNTGRKTEQENKEKKKQKKKNHQREPASSSPSFLHL
jgi:hypothetical protein